jgi:hypothetical protein
VKLWYNSSTIHPTSLQSTVPSAAAAAASIAAAEAHSCHTALAAGYACESVRSHRLQHIP